MAARGFLFGGDLYMARFVNGVAGPLQGPFSGAEFGIEPQVNQVDKVSKGRNTYGQLLESVALQQPTNFTVTLDEGSPQALALALMGSLSALTQASGTWTDQAFNAAAALGDWVQLPKIRIAASGITVENTGGTTTYVEGTDYELNRELGLFRALVGGAITASQALLISGGYGAVSGSLIAGATAADIRVKFILDGKNLADNTPCVVTVDEAIVAPSAAVDFLNSDFISMPLSGRMKTQTGKSSPFTVELRNV